MPRVTRGSRDSLFLRCVVTQNPVMQIDDFVSDGGDAFDGERDQGRVAALWLELGQIGRRHLAALAGNLEQPILVNQPLDTDRQIERLPGFEALDVLEHVTGVRFDRRLAQPSQPGRFTDLLALEQIVETMPVPARQRLGQGFVDAPVGAGDRLGTDSLDDIQCRQDDVPVSQRIEDAYRQHNALVSLQ